MAAGIEEDTTAGHIDGLAGSGIEDTPAPNQLPLHIQLNFVPSILPAVSGDRVAFGGVFFPAHHEVKSPPLSVSELSSLCGCHSKNNSHEGTWSVPAVLP